MLEKPTPPDDFLHRVIRQVPVVKYALGLAGLAAAAALIRGFLPDVSFFAMLPVFAGVFVGMIVLLLLAAVAAQPERRLHLPAQVFIWTASLCICAMMFATVTAIISGQPQFWADRILPRRAAEAPLVPGPTKAEQNSGPVPGEQTKKIEQAPPKPQDPEAPPVLVSQGEPVRIRDGASICGKKAPGAATLIIMPNKHENLPRFSEFIQNQLSCDRVFVTIGASSIYAQLAPNALSYNDDQIDFETIQRLISASKQMGVDVDRITTDDFTTAGQIALAHDPDESGAFSADAMQAIQSARTKPEFQEALRAARGY